MRVFGAGLPPGAAQGGESMHAIARRGLGLLLAAGVADAAVYAGWRWWYYREGAAHVPVAIERASTALHAVLMLMWIAGLLSLGRLPKMGLARIAAGAFAVRLSVSLFLLVMGLATSFGALSPLSGSAAGLSWLGLLLISAVSGAVGSMLVAWSAREAARAVGGDVNLHLTVAAMLVSSVALLYATRLLLPWLPTALPIGAVLEAIAWASLIGGGGGRLLCLGVLIFAYRAAWRTATP